MNNADGWVTIGTALDTKQLEKDIQEAEKELNKYEKEAEKMAEQKLKMEAEIDFKEADLRRKINEIKKKAEAQKIGIGTTIGKDTLRRAKIDALAQEKINALAAQYDLYIEQASSKLNEIDKKLADNESKQKTINENVKTLNGELTNARKELYEISNFDKIGNFLDETENSLRQITNSIGENIKSAVNDVGNSVKKITKRIVGWGLALFGIRGAYSLISRAMTTITNEDEQLKAQLDYMRNVVAYSLEPLIRKIVELARTLMLYINHIFIGMTGKPLFNFEKAFETAKKNSEETLKNVTKTLAGFDEMNVLNSNSSSSSTVDLSGLQNFDNLSESTVEKLQKIGKALQPVYNMIKEIIEYAIEHPDVIAGIIGGAGLLSLLGKVIGLAGVGGAAGTGLAGILGLLLAIASIGVITVSIITIYDEIKKAEEAQKNLNTQIESTKQSAEEVTSTYKEYISTITEADEQTKIFTKGLINTSNTALNQVNALNEDIKSWNYWTRVAKNGTGELASNEKAITENINEVYNHIQALTEQYEQGKLDIEQRQEYKELVERFIQTLEKEDGQLDTNIGMYAWQVDGLDKLKNMYSSTKSTLDKLNNTFDSTNESASDAASGIDEVTQAMQEAEKNKSVELKVTADTSSAKKSLSDIFSGIPAIIGKIISFGGGFRAKGGIYYPKLAAGGIINQPGRGVPYHGATIGERGAEAVVPLTDSQQMALLGEAIGKYININATVPVYVGNRQIAREMRKIEAEDNFAYNRG